MCARRNRPSVLRAGNQSDISVTGAQSAEACFIFEGITSPGGGPPPHLHQHQEESFYLLKGTFTIEAAGQTFQATPGDFVHIPRDTMHSFRNEGNVDAIVLTTVSPAGPTGLEKFFEEAFYPATDRSAAPAPITQELMNRIKTASAKNGIEFPRAVEFPRKKL